MGGYVKANFCTVKYVYGLVTLQMVEVQIILMHFSFMKAKYQEDTDEVPKKQHVNFVLYMCKSRIHLLILNIKN